MFSTSPLSYRSLFARLAIVVALFAALNAFVAFRLGPEHATATTGESGLVNAVRRTAPEVLVLGSSRTKRHYDDRLLADAWHVSVLNAGADGQGMPFARVLFDLGTCDRKPGLVIIDVMAFDPDLVRVHALDDWYDDSRVLRTMPKPGSHGDAASVPEDWRMRVMMRLPMYRFGGRSTAAFGVKGPDGATPGFAPMPPRTGKPWKPAPDAAAPNRSYPWLRPQLAALVDECRAAGAKVVLTCSPAFDRTVLAGILDVAKSVAREKNAPFIDASDPATFGLADPKWFHDEAHLGAAGAEIFSRRMAETLRPHVDKALAR